MARDPIKLTIQGDDDDGLRFERWLAVMLTLCGGDSHPELVRLMMERIERGEEIRARNLGVRVTRNNVTEPTPGTIAHRVWDIISRLRKPDGSVDRHNVLNAAVKGCKGRDQSGHSNGPVEPMEEVSWHEWKQVSWHEERGSDVKWAELPGPVAWRKVFPKKASDHGGWFSRFPSLAPFRMLGLRSAITHS